jgi:hypothetical protein
MAEVRGVDGKAVLDTEEGTLTFMFSGVAALAAKKKASPRSIPLHAVEAVDFKAPTNWRSGYLRVRLVGATSPPPPATSDVNALGLGAGRRIAEAQEFAARLGDVVASAEPKRSDPALLATAPHAPASSAGPDGVVSFADDAVTLIHKGIGLPKMKKDASPRVIPLGAVESVEYTEGSFIRPGVLRLRLRGEDGYAHDARNDLNAISLFQDKTGAAFVEALKEAVAAADPVEGWTSEAGTAPAPQYRPTKAPRDKTPRAGTAPAPQYRPTKAPREYAPKVRAQKFAGVTLQGDMITYKRQSQPVAGVKAEVESVGQLRQRTTATRVAAGTIVGGPIGAVVGGLLRKKVDDRQLFLLIDGPKYAWAIPVDVTKKHQTKAREFAAKVTTAGKQQADD